MRSLVLLSAWCAALLVACEKPAQPASADSSKPRQTLSEARRGVQTKLLRKERIGEPVERPPRNFRQVAYESPVGKLAAYIARPENKAGKLPAIVWLVGGFSNSISSHAWNPGPVANDQSASIFWKSGIVTMYPSLRGGNENPGNLETFFGEVDDVLAAADFLARQPDVDPARIYLGGHSTGGTLAMLVAECGGKFRGVFAFGPVGDPAGYGQDAVVFDVTNRKEAALRAPIHWMHGITSPTFVFEGDKGGSNIDSLRELKDAPHPHTVNFFPVKGADHFSVIRPMSALIVKKILSDSDSSKPITFSAEELSSVVAQ